MFWRIEVWQKPALADPVAQGVLHDLADLDITGVRAVTFVQVFILEGDITPAQLRRIAEELLCDPVSQECRYGPLDEQIFVPASAGDRQVLEIAFNPGVMDPWEDSTRKAISDLGITGVWDVKTGSQFIFYGVLSARQLHIIGEKLLYNKVIQHPVQVRHLADSLQAHRDISYQFEKITVPMRNCDEAALTALSTQRQLSLTRAEMVTIQRYFIEQKRDPTDVELETVAQTWSEHCMHKTFRGTIQFTDKSGKTVRSRRIVNLLKSTIAAATQKVNKPWCVSVFKDNAGIITFDTDYDVCFKVETHNHPSALDPYGGAGTGIGGVIRDILGVGMGAKPIMNTDVFCFGQPTVVSQDLPAGVLHPKRIMKGVIAGVRDYGNRMGIPTANGAVLFDERYIGNPLVYCGTVGIMPRGCAFGQAAVGDLVVVIGGRTGRDGIHGATFSSVELTHESETVSSGAVQIGNAITEKKVLDVLLQARDLGLYTAVTDCGAGGLSSAVGEMGEKSGVRVDLDTVPLKYKGLSYTEIWISEAQERLVLSVPPRHRDQLLKLFAQENVDAAVIGEITDTGRLELFYQQQPVADLDMRFLFGGVPALVREAVWQPPVIRRKRGRQPQEVTASVLQVLSDFNVCSKEWIIRQYDHEVQGMSVLKPLAGARNDGPQDAAVLQPVPGRRTGIAVSCGINPGYADIDPYWMACSVIEEALRQIVAVGGDLERVAILDNFSWGNTARPECLGQLVRCCQGCYDAAVAYGVPFISGKDSLNNEYAVADRTIVIPGTLLISALGIVEDVERTISMDAKAPGNIVYVVGRTYSELGGGVYERVQGWRSADVPRVRFRRSRRILAAMCRAGAAGLIRSCHDCSDGGLAVALAEMAFAGDLGMRLDLRRVPASLTPDERRDDIILFSESNSRFVVEVAPADESAFRAEFRGCACAPIGRIVAEPEVVVTGLSGKPVVECRIESLRQAWQNPLRG